MSEDNEFFKSRCIPASEVRNWVLEQSSKVNEKQAKLNDVIDIMGGERIALHDGDVQFALGEVAASRKLLNELALLVLLNTVLHPNEDTESVDTASHDID